MTIKKSCVSQNESRKGLIDVWNAFMLEGAIYSSNDIPLCPTTAKEIPEKLISYSEAKTIHKKRIKQGDNNYHINAFIHFYIDDQKFDGKRNSIWLYPKEALEIIKHFDGIIAPDFSTYADFPEPLKRWNYFRMNTFGYWVGKNGIQVVYNSRWGTEETWKYCFDGAPKHSMIAVGSVASGIKRLENRPLFEKGLYKMVETVHPHTILVYGSAKYPFFDKLRDKHVNIVEYISQTNEAYCKRRGHE